MPDMFLSHLRLPDGLDEFGVREVEGAGDLLGGEPGVDPLLPQVRVSLVVLRSKIRYNFFGNPELASAINVYKHTYI